MPAINPTCVDQGHGARQQPPNFFPFFKYFFFIKDESLISLAILPGCHKSVKIQKTDIENKKL